MSSRTMASTDEEPEHRLADPFAEGGQGHGPALGPDQQQHREDQDEEIDGQLDLQDRPIDPAPDLQRSGSRIRVAQQHGRNDNAKRQRIPALATMRGGDHGQRAANPGPDRQSRFSAKSQGKRGRALDQDQHERPHELDCTSDMDLSMTIEDVLAHKLRKQSVPYSKPLISRRQLILDGGLLDVARHPPGHGCQECSTCPPALPPPVPRRRRAGCGRSRRPESPGRQRWAV